MGISGGDMPAGLEILNAMVTAEAVVHGLATGGSLR
jgi:ATP-dependent protease ClpP protease subunit